MFIYVNRTVPLKEKKQETQSVELRPSLWLKPQKMHSCL